MERAAADASFSRLAARPRSRNFRAWSGAQLFRYFHRDDSVSQSPPDSTQRRAEQAESEEELKTRRERLQDLLRQVDREQMIQQKKKKIG